MEGAPRRYSTHAATTGQRQTEERDATKVWTHSTLSETEGSYKAGLPNARLASLLPFIVI